MITAIGCGSISEFEIGYNFAAMCSDTGCGAGFAIDDHTWITTHHMVEDSPYVAILLAEGRVIGKVKRVIPEKDLVILDVPHYTVENPFDTCKGRVGQHVVSCGYRNNEIVGCNDGWIQSTKKIEPDLSATVPLILASTKVFHGYSGGPMLNHDSCAVGMILATDGGRWAWAVDVRGLVE